MKKYILLIIILVLFVSTLLLPLWLKDNILLFYGTVMGGITTLIAVIISITHDSLLVREKRIPFLQTKMERMYIEEFKEQRHKLPYKYITELDGSKDLVKNEIQTSEWLRTGTEYNNAFYTISLYNTNKEFSLLGFSISIDGDLIVKDVFIKADSIFQYVIGFHTGIFDNAKHKSRIICVTYRYKSIDLDRTYEQQSRIELYISSNNEPVMRFLSPPIGRRK